MLVDGENSGEVFIVPQDGYMGSTFKQLWISSSMYEPYVLAFIRFYKETLVNHQYSVPTIYQRVSRTCILNKVLIF